MNHDSVKPYMTKLHNAINNQQNAFLQTSVHTIYIIST